MHPKRSFVGAVLAPLLSVLFSAHAHATGLVAADLPPIEHREASLTLVSVAGTTAIYTPAEIEAYPTYSITTKTPWRDDPARFEGVRLRDVLAAHGLAQLDQITIRAENDFVVTMDRKVWEAEDFLIATRVDGQAHSRRARGPLQFVLDWDAYVTSDVATESHLAWMAVEIAPLN